MPPDSSLFPRSRKREDRKQSETGDPVSNAVVAEHAKCAQHGEVSATVVDYWDERAVSYSCNVREELEGEDLAAWSAVLKRHLPLPEAEVGRALDLGCGPGFFSIILAQQGFVVDAVDASRGMLTQAAANVKRAQLADSVSFHEGDVSRLPFSDNEFDAVVLRNVTWLMRDPEAAYAEWRRVLAPGGKLLVFDANWYRYLSEPSINEKRRCDQADRTVLGWSDEACATLDQERRCEIIAADLPFTYIDRPVWDCDTLKRLGFSSVEADERVWEEVWPAGDKAFYATSPLFLIEAVK